MAPEICLDQIAGLFSGTLYFDDPLFSIAEETSSM